MDRSVLKSRLDHRRLKSTCPGNSEPMEGRVLVPRSRWLALLRVAQIVRVARRQSHEEGSHVVLPVRIIVDRQTEASGGQSSLHRLDRKSSRLNSSHLGISYAVFCLKK